VTHAGTPELPDALWRNPEPKRSYDVAHDPAALTDEEWARYLFFRANPKGAFAERWHHAAGCRRWFNAVRDTATYRFSAVYRPDETQPEIR
jgi:heterotetrameric sarcosine oxidase delta subunit